MQVDCWSFDAAPVAQSDRVADFESEGCRFESCRARFLSHFSKSSYIDPIVDSVIPDMALCRESVPNLPPIDPFRQATLLILPQ
jgi:hypothetical protein